MAESPAVAKWIVRAALREARETESLTQGEVAKSLDWSLSKIQRIESGEVTVSTTDLLAMVRHYGNVTAQDAERLVELVRISRQRKGWWDRPEYKANLTTPMFELLQFESEATALRAFNPSVLPGLLQTEQYAQAVMAYWAPELEPTERSVRLEVRGRRRKNFLERKGKRPRYKVLLDESVLHRQVGGPKVMEGQLEELLADIERGVVKLGILPLDAPNPALARPFIVLEFGDQPDASDAADAVLYQESSLHDEIVTLTSQVKLFRQRFDRMSATATDEIHTELLIRRRLDNIRRSMRE